ncbi:MAG: hypothetical protein A2527_13530 [Candidatus Lambdaproteobacteria bacterium RIFOXYD2_FULL_50_16]|uniref:Hemerythrin-like domain-containing protein n=1 Tax=Candidatus Lambdaproteobacteria bacterium RIFOXYD2_FULL_50_16 TaxID=1817772 RepID=A0A1F6G581_9PROT|nr:MAG: hypothetical protein A2527_13530 [Candidatus Lambdaproteobacteria bacterium RIFOXYD2_FULL_50_16]
MQNKLRGGEMHIPDLIDWGPRFELGIDSIDQQHRALVNMINALQTAMAFGDSRPLLDQLFTDLAAYANSHFAFEHELLESVQFPGLREHLTKHERYKNRLQSLKEEFLGKKSFLISTKVKEFLREWFYQHVLVEDAQFASYLTNKINS